MSKKLKVFISSRIQELADERQAVANLLPTIKDNTYEIEAWVFEADARASSESIRQVYLTALESCDLYIGIFWNGYGEWTIDEYHKAGEVGIPRHVYVKNVNPEQRDPRLSQFLERESDVRFGITPRWFNTLDEFKEQVSRSLRLWLQNQSIEHHSSTTAVIATLADAIPDLPRKLIGRKNLTRRVLDLLENNDRVLLRGFGGTGKTALAATIAADYIDAGFGQVIWIKSGTASADSIFEALGRVFDQQQEVLAAEGEEREHLVRQMLARNKGLLVLDDVWNGTALARVANTLPRRMPLLATSRQRYPLDEVIEVGQLDASEALKLLIYHARMDLEDDSDAVRLCQLLGNHAFALEIAGKSLKVYQMTPTELLKRIEEAPHELTVPAGFGELGRTGVKSLLDASIDALNRDLYDTYVIFGGMFEPSATANLISRVLDKDEASVRFALTELVQRGLLSQWFKNDVEYFQLHDLAYSYARTTFISKGHSYQPVVQACHDFAIDFADNLSMLDVEITNLIEAAESAYRNGHLDLLIGMMSALAITGTYFAARGHTMRTITLMRSAIDAAEEAEQLEVAHHLWGKLGNAYAAFLGQYDNALEAYQESLYLARHIGNRQREAILLTVIGSVRFRQGEQDSDAYHALAEDIAREDDDAIVLCQVLLNRGGEALGADNPDYEKGRRLSAEAADIARKHNIPHLLFYSLLNRGAGEHELGQLERAIATHEDAFEVGQQQGNLNWMADAMFSIGEDYHALNQRDVAQEKLDTAMQYAKDCSAVTIINKIIEFMEEHRYQVPV